VDESKAEEPAKPGKVKIVAEETAPKKVTIVDESKAEEPPKPTKVTIVDESKAEEPPKPTKVTIVDESKSFGESPIPKPKGPRPQNISVTIEDPDSPRPAPAAKPPPKKPPAKAPPKKPDYLLVNWVDLPADKYAATVAQLKPKDLNPSLGSDWNGDVVVKLLATFEKMDNHVRAFEFLEELTANKMLSMHLTKTHRVLASPLIIQIMDSADVDNGRKAGLRKAWKLDD
jgi:hypothetical protein